MNNHPRRRPPYQLLLTHLSRVHDAVIPSGANWGQVLPNEGEFLMNRILDEQPVHVLEIGTAGGASSAHILAALELLGGTRRLTSIECLDHCYFDPARKPGFIVDLAFPTPPAGFNLHCGVSSLDLEGILADAPPVDLLFVDGNHTHPWATLDTALALPFLAPEATVVYHDINLHLRGGASKCHDKGAHLLFYHLPARQKQVLGEFPYPNIGSLRLVGHAPGILAELLTLMFRFPWETQAWPPLDEATLRRFREFLGRHFDRRFVAAFLHGLEAMRALQNP